jgi:hypothetical protein
MQILLVFLLVHLLESFIGVKTMTWASHHNGFNKLANLLIMSQLI